MRSTTWSSARSSVTNNHRSGRSVSRQPVMLIALVLMAALLAATFGGPAGAAPSSFAVAVPFTTNTSPRAVAVGDLNGDGLLDPVTANKSDSTMSVLLNTPTIVAYLRSRDKLRPPDAFIVNTFPSVPVLTGVRQNSSNARLRTRQPNV